MQRGRNEKILQYCLDSCDHILNMRAIQGRSGGNKGDLSLQDNVEIPYKWTEFINHVGSSGGCNSVLRAGFIAGGKDTKEGRQTVFFTAVDPMNERDVTKPRQVPCRTRWKVYQNAVCWINLKSHYSVPADCLEKVVHTMNCRTSVSEDSFIAASATKSSSEECLASSNVQHEDHHQRGTGAG